MRKILIFLMCGVIWLSQSAFLVIGHRGDPLTYPEETLQSFDSAFQNGADFVELDLHLSKDNQLIVSHDRNLKRVTNIDAIVSQNTLADLKVLKQANGESIHTLDEVFAYYQNQPQTKFLIETKKTKKNNPQNMEALLADLITKYQYQNRVYLQSFNAQSMSSLKQLLPKVPRILIVNDLADINFENLSDVDGINISSKLVTATLIKQLHALNKKVYVWDQMQEQESQWNWLVNLPIDGVITNYPFTGYQYKLAKSTSKDFTIAKTGINLSSHALTIYENPYQAVPTKKKVKPLANVEIKSGVKINETKYYQIAEQQYIKAAAINFTKDPAYLAQFLNGQLTSIYPYAIPTYSYPDQSYAVTGQLMPQQSLKITGVNFNNQNYWFETKAGWVKGSDVLVTTKSQNNSTQNGFTNYQLKLNSLMPSYQQSYNFFNDLFIFSTLKTNFNARIRV